MVQRLPRPVRGPVRGPVPDAGLPRASVAPAELVPLPEHPREALCRAADADGHGAVQATHPAPVSRFDLVQPGQARVRLGAGDRDAVQCGFLQGHFQCAD